MELLDPLPISTSAFLSHSHKDRKLASDLKRNFNKYNIKAFVAHRDIDVSAEWEKGILKKLKKCELFFPLLTDNFIESKWTDQETGFAVSRRKIIVPLSAGVTPYGFIAKIQAQKIQDSIDLTTWNVVRTLVKHRRIGKKLRLQVIKYFLDSINFKTSAVRANRLRELEPFSKEELTLIVKGSAQNSQIFDGYAARDVVRDLLRAQPNLVAAKLVNDFEERTQRGYLDLS
jgi:hypothetical protein